MNSEGPFSWASFITGLFVAVILGGMANVAMGFVVFASRSSRYVTPFLFMIPGVGLALVAWSMRRSRDGFAQGLIVGGCVVALFGGICGFTQY